MPTESRREQLSALGGPPAHAGLYLARYAQRIGDPESTAEFLTRSALIEPGEVYKAAFRRWKETKTSANRAEFELALTSPLAIGLGSASVTEVGLTTHHTYGMPLIPGSALKGLCVRGLKQWAAATGLAEGARIDAGRVLFGEQNKDNPAAAGYATFWDAWFVPGAGKPFHRDVLTVHHPRYYNQRGNADRGGWPLESEDPNPVPFLVTPPGAKFFFRVDAPAAEWASFTENLLRWSLANLGVGAKTNAGYGYFAPEGGVRPAVGPGQQAGGAAAAQPAAPQRQIWAGARLSYNGGRGEFTARSADGANSAMLGRPGSEVLRTKLGPEVMDPLKKKAREGVEATVEAVGNGYKLLDVNIPGG